MALPNNVCLLMRVFSPFTLNATNDVLEFRAASLLFVFYLSHLFLVPSLLSSVLNVF